jgi:DNA-binding CsgD family transcriptional regulator
MDDLLRVIEAAYDAEGDELDWMGHVVHAAQPILDDGLGVGSFVYDASAPPRLRIEEATATAGYTRVFAAAVKLAGALITPRYFARALGATCGTASEIMGGKYLVDTFGRSDPKKAGSDLLGINCGDPSQRGCAIIAPRRKRGPASAETVATWEKVGAHIAAGLRLRRSVRRVDGSSIEPLDDAEAVLDPDGRLRHAVGPATSADARAALRFAALSLDRARSRNGRRDVQETLAAWQALVDGRWTVFDHFDRDGRRFVIARRNDPDAPDNDALTLRERQVLGYAAMGHTNKLIAYELGLSPSTVATHLSAAAAKLGVETRVALIRKFASE